jgi:phage terminase large subunit-like protein
MGGDMVEAVLRQVDRSVPVRMVRATGGKFLRASPSPRSTSRAR